jgi:hypothetical protein
MQIRIGTGYRTFIIIRHGYAYATVGSGTPRASTVLEINLTYGTLQLGQRAQPAVQAVDVKQQARLVRLRIPPILALVLV